MDGLGLPAHGQPVRTRWIYNGKPARLGVLSGGNNWSIAGAACLVELAFVDSAEDAKVLKQADYPRRAAECLFRGIQAYLGRSTDAPAVDVPTDHATADVDEYRRLVRQVQQFLTDSGFSPGPVDGMLGPKTLGAADRLEAWA